MKSQTNSTVAKLRKFLLVTALAITPLLAFQTGNAQQTATATLLSGGLNNITITQGGSFTLTLAVTINFTSSGYTVFLQSNNGIGLFTLTGRTNLSAIFTDPTTSDAVAFTAANGLLNPSNARDLGYTGDTVTNQPPGSGIQLMTLNITSMASAAPGMYTIFLDNRSIMTDFATFGDINMGGPSGPQFTVTILPIPEPTTVGLAILGGAALLVAARRKLRA